MADTAWPIASFKPQLTSWQMRPPEMLRRSEFDDGEDRVRRTGSFRPYTFQVTVHVTMAEIAVFRAWFESELDYGRNWFDLSALIDGSYQAVEARLVPQNGAPWTLRLVDEVYAALSFGYEVRIGTAIKALAPKPVTVSGSISTIPAIPGIDLFSLSLPDGTVLAARSGDPITAAALVATGTGWDLPSTQVDVPTGTLSLLVVIGADLDADETVGALERIRLTVPISADAATFTADLAGDQAIPGGAARVTTSSGVRVLGGALAGAIRRVATGG
jgi:hypothetical protein